ncbi:hypothetical protein GCM10007315_13570 [Gemmobacter tilapiae]|uniref:Uncharacterized protein n=1 Tax=Neogemmobacter tilapiae TaxID=875041 RepID=A0A918TKW8_9RHOB|nr:hypothetical protein GCM10007315_13570 [Gemmobacter tilapiae]
MPLNKNGSAQQITKVFLRNALGTIEDTIFSQQLKRCGIHFHSYSKSAQDAEADFLKKTATAISEVAMTGGFTFGASHLPVSGREKLIHSTEGDAGKYVSPPNLHHSRRQDVGIFLFRIEHA